MAKKKMPENQIQADLEGKEAKTPFTVSWRPQVQVAIENVDVKLTTTAGGIENLKTKDDADPESFVQSHLKVKAGRSLNGKQFDKVVKELVAMIDKPIGDLEEMATKKNDNGEEE